MTSNLKDFIKLFGYVSTFFEENEKLAQVEKNESGNTKNIRPVYFIFLYSNKFEIRNIRGIFYTSCVSS